MAEQYQAISEEQQKKATAFFDKARAVGSTGNFEFAIEMYIQGLQIDPENLEGHMELREISMKRMA